MVLFFFFFNDTATTEIYTLSLHDALPICATLTSPEYCSRLMLLLAQARGQVGVEITEEEMVGDVEAIRRAIGQIDRKSTRLNSSHTVISYAVFCLKKKKEIVPNAVARTNR